MTNLETAAHLRKWVAKGHNHFSWPTDACGHDQHIKFVRYRNDNWPDEKVDFDQFVLAYADLLESTNALPSAP